MTKEKRRCAEERYDFNHTDNPKGMFPIQILKGQKTFGFCPGKATWDHEAVNIFKMLLVSFEYKTLPFAGSVSEQPHWVVELLNLFATSYDSSKFVSRAKMILGDEKKGAKPHGFK